MVELCGETVEKCCKTVKQCWLNRVAGTVKIVKVELWWKSGTVMVNQCG